jgi:hypothetical protein
MFHQWRFSFGTLMLNVTMPAGLLPRFVSAPLSALRVFAFAAFAGGFVALFLDWRFGAGADASSIGEN